MCFFCMFLLEFLREASRTAAKSREFRHREASHGGVNMGRHGACLSQGEQRS